jgi:diguanylate cyclase (GGDEF)-like protein
MAAMKPRQSGTWLCPTESDRARLEDMTARMLPASLAIVLLSLPLIVALALRVGPIVVIPYLAAGVIVIAIGTAFRSRTRPEYWFFGGDLAVLFAMGAAVALTGGSLSPLLPALAIALVAGACRHTHRGLLVYSLMIVAVAGLACALASGRTVNYDDLRLPGFLTMIVSIAILVIMITRAERTYRDRSLVDALTGTLNRFAMEGRLQEFRAQLRLGDSELCVIAADIDHFKQINDSHGHDAGDDVLREIAQVLRANLRSFPLLYRTGGEEFLAMLPGLSCAEGRRIAERLRAAVAASLPRGIPVTMSFGVAAMETSGADPAAIISAADRCLYRAKHRGRDCVVAGALTPGPPLPVVSAA